MTEHIDHAARIEELVTLSWTADNDEKGWLLAEAQIHATLALVEQQRIANLIALAGSPVSEVASAGKSALLEVERADGYGPYIPPKVRSEIRKGLGL